MLLFLLVSARRLVGSLKMDFVSPSYTIIHGSLFLGCFDFLFYFVFLSFAKDICLLNTSMGEDKLDINEYKRRNITT